MALHTTRQVGRPENVVGWYHSHPGYGCWLSGIDVATQLTNQMYLDPFLAIVIDPNRTISAGKVEIGAFRAYPEVRAGVAWLLGLARGQCAHGTGCFSTVCHQPTLSL